MNACVPRCVPEGRAGLGGLALGQFTMNQATSTLFG